MDPSFPIGKFTPPAQFDAATIATLTQEIEDFPARFRQTAHALPPGALDKPYREGGWTGRQVIHHVADSHMHSYIRFRWALTEDTPTIKPYEEKLWAELPDARSADIGLSLTLLDSLHRRWAALMRAMTPDQWTRPFRHPELGIRTLDITLALYAWHGKHHLGHLQLLA